MGRVLQLLHYALLYWRLEVLLVLLLLQHSLSQAQPRSHIELLLQLFSLFHHQSIRGWLLGTSSHLGNRLIIVGCLLYDVRLLAGINRVAHVEIVCVHHQVACGLVIYVGCVDWRVFIANNSGVVMVVMWKWLVDSDLSVAQDLLPFQVPQRGQLQVHEPEVFLEPFKLHGLNLHCVFHPDEFLFTHWLVLGNLRPGGSRSGPRPTPLV